MRILVCVKQVPGSNNAEVDPVTGVLKRIGISSKINPYDLYGIEMALALAIKTSSTRKYICPCCGMSVRATRTVRIACMDCDTPLILAV